MESTNQNVVKARIVMAMLFLAAGLASLLVREDLYSYYQIAPQKVLLFALLSFSTSGAILALLYLKGEIRIPVLERIASDVASDSADSESRVQLERFARSITHLRSDLEKLRERVDKEPRHDLRIPESERQELVASLRESLPKQVASELKGQFEREAVDARLRLQVREIFDASVSRLRGEISALTRRGNLNLVIGVFTTTAAVVLLAYMVLGASVDFDDMQSLLAHYIPRLATATFIEIFSFFFLKLYRSSLSEIRYYQDELTRLSEVRVLLMEAEAAGDGETLKLAMETILKSGSVGSESGPKEAVSSSASRDVAKLVEQAVKVASAAGAGRA